MRWQLARTCDQLRQFTSITLELGFGVNRVKAQAEAELLVQTVSTAQVQVKCGQVSFTAVSPCGVTVVEFCRQAVVAGDRAAYGKLIVNRLNIMQVWHPGGRGDVLGIEAGTGR
ncbi:hypothetical protein D3C72_2004470 [compost metagenome]